MFHLDLGPGRLFLYVWGRAGQGWAGPTLLVGGEGLGRRA